MSTDFGFTELECKIIKAQIERRAQYRQMFLKARTDPCMHKAQAGYVFDPAMQRFLSMKVSQLDYFTFNPKTISFAIFTIVLPMGLYGYAIYTKRQEWLREIMCGNIKPKDRLFKYC